MLYRVQALDALRRRGERNAELHRQLVEQLRSGEGLDVDTAYEARERGWSH